MWARLHSTKVRIGLALASLALIGGGVVVYRYVADDAAQHEVYEVAPDFSLPGEDGTPITLTSIESPVRIINFWATWSPYSPDELRMLARIEQAFGDEVVVIALDRDTNLREGREFVGGLGLSNEITFVFDEVDAYFKEVRGFAVPETLVLDSEGNVRMRSRGPVTYEMVEASVREVLANE